MTLKTRDTNALWEISQMLNALKQQVGHGNPEASVAQDVANALRLHEPIKISLVFFIGLCFQWIWQLTQVQRDLVDT